jgi:hypothetical protein
MINQSTTVLNTMSEIRALSDEAWVEFTANSPEGIDYVAEASVRGLIIARIRHALARGEADRRALRENALSGL